MEGGAALTRILFGDVNPSGKLPFTVPVRQDDLPYFRSTDEQFTYDRYHGYTWFTKNDVKPAYPFGFGLSYASFDISEIAADRHDSSVVVSAIIRNTSVRDGAEVLQVYASLPDSRMERAPYTLIGFVKVNVRAGQSADARVEIPLERLAIYDPHHSAWIIEPGTYQFLIGTSSDRDALTVVGVAMNEEIQL
jgi:beta-glucosidase